MLLRRMSLRKAVVQHAEVRVVPSHKCQLTPQSDPVTYRIYQGILIQCRRKMWKFITVDPANPHSKRILKSAAQIWEEEIRHLDQYPRVIHPFSQFRYIWQTFIMFIWFALLICVPVSIASIPYAESIVYVKTALDLLCHIDIILWFFTGYYDKNKQIVVLKFRKVVKHYLVTFFLVDLISSQPIQLYLHVSNRTDLHKLTCLVLLKLLRVPTLLRYFQQFSERANFCTANIKFISFTVWVCVLISWITSVIYMILQVLKSAPLLKLAVRSIPMLMTAFRVARTLMVVGVTDIINTSNLIMLCQIGFIMLGAVLQIIILETHPKMLLRRLSLRKAVVQHAEVRVVPSHKCQLTPQSDPVTYRIYQGILIQCRRKMWKFITVDPANPHSKRILKSAAQIWEEEIRHLDQYPRVIHPFSQFRYVWQTFMMFIWFALLICVPVSIASIPYAESIVYAKTALDLLCHIDIILWFFTGYYDKNKQIVVLKFRKVVKHYLVTFFLVDLISSQPIQLYLHVSNRTDLHKLMCLVLLKLLRVPTLLRYFQQFSERAKFCTANIKFISFTVWVCVLISWITSVIYMIIQVLNSAPLLKLSLRSVPMLMTAFRVARTLMVVGVTDIINTSNLVMISQIGFIMLGAVLQIIILAKVMQFYQKRSSSKNKYNNLREEIGEYMKYKELPGRLRYKILRYLDFKFQKHIFREEDILSNLSSVLKHDILMERCQNMIERVEFFKNLPPPVILRIVTKLRSEIFLPNDVIVLAGYAGNAMYFIYMGTVAVYTGNGKEICHLEDGSHFGEIALVINEPRVATVIAVKECELFRLSRRDFQEAIEPFPELNEKIREIAMSRLEKTMKMMSDINAVSRSDSNESTSEGRLS